MGPALIGEVRGAKPETAKRFDKSDKNAPPIEFGMFKINIEQLADGIPVGRLVASVVAGASTGRRRVSVVMLSSRSVVSAQEKLAVLNCRRLPGRLNTAETALLLGFQEHDIGPLVAAKLLVPLGKPAANSPKYFAAVEILERGANPQWLEDATKALKRLLAIKESP